MAERELIDYDRLVGLRADVAAAVLDGITRRWPDAVIRTHPDRAWTVVVEERDD